MHKIQPNQKVKIIQIEIAVPIYVDIADEMTAHLSENGIMSDDSDILDWSYTFNEWTTTATDDPEEDEIFNLPRTKVR